MALKLKYTDEHGIVHINMSPKTSPRDDLQDPKFDTINHRFGQYDLFGSLEKEGTIEDSSSGDQPSLFRSRYNSIEEELANTPYAFATDRPLRNQLDITIDRTDVSPSKDIEDNRFFNRKLSLEYDDLFRSDAPAFTVTQLIHAQDRYFDLSSRQSVDLTIQTDISDISKDFTSSELRKDRVNSVDGRVTQSLRTSSVVDAFKVLNSDVKEAAPAPASAPCPVVLSTPKRKNEKSFAILTETSTSRPSSPRSLPVDLPARPERISPFKGRGFREGTSRHNTPKTSAANSRNNSPPRRKKDILRRTNSLSRIDKMAAVTLPPPILLRPLTPIDFVRQNIEEVRELSELNREKNEADAERRKQEEEDEIEREMELQEKVARSVVNSRVGSRANSRSNSRVNSRSNSRTNSRSNSPIKINLRSRSNSPSTALSKAAAATSVGKSGAIASSKVAATAGKGATISAKGKPNLVKPSVSKDVKTKPSIFINKSDGMPKPTSRTSRVTTRAVSKSQPQSNDGSPKHSKIPKRQSSVSPVRTTGKRVTYISKRPVENNLNNQRFMSSSTSSIHETIKVGSQIHDKRFRSQQNLSISPKHIKGKPPISPGRGGPPPSNQRINAKRLSPIVGTPNKSPVELTHPIPKSSLKPTIKKTGTTPIASRVNSRQPSRAASRDPSPEKRKSAKTPVTKPSTINKPISRTLSIKSLSKPASGKTTGPEARKTIDRTDSMKSLTRAPSNLSGKPPLKKVGSKSSLSAKFQSTSKVEEVGKKEDKTTKSDDKEDAKAKNKVTKQTTDTATDPDKNLQQDNETQYDKITNEKGELVIMTKKSIMSMTTAAITSQPLELVTTVTNQLPTTLEKAREKGIFERHSSKDSLTGKDDAHKKDSDAKIVDEKKKEEVKRKPIFTEDHKLKPLQGPFNDPQLEKVRQKIDDILKTPEISRENILTASAKFRAKAKTEAKDKPEEKNKTAPEEPKPKEEVKQPEPKLKEDKKPIEQAAGDMRTEATKIVESIITPVEEPKEVPKPPKEIKKVIEPVITVVKEKKKEEAAEKINETLVKGDAEVEVLSSNVSTPGMEKMHLDSKVENGSEKSQSNGGFPQSTSTTPKPPARTKKDKKGKQGESPENEIKDSPENEEKKPNICSRLMGKCKSKCCPCCVKGEDEKETEDEVAEELVGEKKQGMMSKFSCCKKKTKIEEEVEREAERAAGKAATIEFEDETKRKPKLRDILCCNRKRRVGDSGIPPQNIADVTMSPRLSGVASEAGCCGRKRQVERRDSILSDRPPANCCTRLFTWVRGMCRRRAEPVSRRASLFSKNKSLSPTLPPEVSPNPSAKSSASRGSRGTRGSRMILTTEFMKKDTDIEEEIEDTRKKLDPSLVEHTSMIRAAVPVLPIVLAYFCLICNVVVPGLGSIFSGMFCLCFGIPRFGVHDGAKYRIGSFVVNLLVGVLQLFTVLFCLVGWGWSIWWGVIMVKVSRKYRRLRAEAAAAEAEAPPVTTNNHTRA